VVGKNLLRGQKMRVAFDDLHKRLSNIMAEESEKVCDTRWKKDAREKVDAILEDMLLLIAHLGRGIRDSWQEQFYEIQTKILGLKMPRLKLSDDLWERVRSEGRRVRIGYYDRAANAYQSLLRLLRSKYEDAECDNSLGVVVVLNSQGNYIDKILIDGKPIELQKCKNPGYAVRFLFAFKDAPNKPIETEAFEGEDSFNCAKGKSNLKKMVGLDYFDRFLEKLPKERKCVQLKPDVTFREPKKN